VKVKATAHKIYKRMFLVDDHVNHMLIPLKLYFF